MTTAIPANSSGNTALALLQSNTPSESGNGTAASSSDDSSSSAGNSPIDTVQLSDHAKALLERNKVEQAVADKLQTLINPKNSGTAGTATASTTSPQSKATTGPGAAILSKYGKLGGAAEWAREANADNIGLIKSGFGDADKWIDFAKRLDAGEEVQLTPGRNPSDDEQFQNTINLVVAEKIIQYQKNGETGKAQALTDQLNKGTIKVQKTSDVPGLNYDSVTTHFDDGGYGGTSSTTTFHPTADLKAKWENGDSIVLGGSDRGSFYLTWDLPASAASGSSATGSNPAPASTASTTNAVASK